MEDDTILIRTAQIKDGENIQRLLHSDYKSLSMDEINNCLDKLVLLFYRQKLISVTCLEPDGSAWTSVHPMFSQTLLETGVTQLLKGVGLDKAVYAKPKRQRKPLLAASLQKERLYFRTHERPGI